jgi:hypothetical protein
VPNGCCLCGQLRFVAEGDPKWIVYCHRATCGTPIAYETAKRPGEIDLYLNAFDEPERFEPQAHVYFEEHLPWFDTRDDKPRQPRT